MKRIATLSSLASLTSLASLALAAVLACGPVQAQDKGQDKGKAAPPAAAPAKASPAPAAAPAKAAGEIDINSATAAELQTLTGIGEARSAAIIKGRPYKRKDELVQKKVLPQAVYDGIKDKIIAKQKA